MVAATKKKARACTGHCCRPQSSEHGLRDNAADPGFERSSGDALERSCDPSFPLNLHFVSFLSFPSPPFHFLSCSRSCSCCCLFLLLFLSFLLLSLPLRSCPVLFLCSVFPSFFLSSPAPVLSLPFPLRFLFLSLLDSRGEIWTSSRAACNRFLSLPSPNLLISRRLVL